MPQKTKVFSCPLCTPEEGEDAIEITISFSPGYPARTYGPPEDCYPGEGPELLDSSTTCSCSHTPDQLPEEWIDSHLEEMMDNLDSDDFPSASDYIDYDPEY